MLNLKTMKALLIIVIEISCLSTFAQIGAKVKSSTSIEGEWSNQEYGYNMVLIIQSGGKGTFDGENMTYSVSGNQLMMNWEGQVINYNFIVANNVLTLSGGDLDNPIKFIRKGETALQTQVFTETNKLLYGTWVGHGEELVFQENGMMSFNGSPLKYEISGNRISIQTISGNAEFQFALQQELLTLSTGGQTATYSRKGSNVAKKNPVSPDSGTVASEMVGKWCYVNVTSTNSGGWSTDECFTLYQNGTYEYYSENSGSATGDGFYGGVSGQSGDIGTWSVQGNQLIVNSQTHGQTIYVFEKRNHPKNNDPMIVINGRSFVTQYQKQPWR